MVGVACPGSKPGSPGVVSARAGHPPRPLGAGHWRSARSAMPSLAWRSPGRRTPRRAPVKSRCASRRVRVPSCGGCLGVYGRLPHAHEHGPSGDGERPGPRQVGRGWSWAPCLSREGAGGVGLLAPSGLHRAWAQAVPPPGHATSRAPGGGRVARTPVRHWPMPRWSWERARTSRRHAMGSLPGCGAPRAPTPSRRAGTGQAGRRGSPRGREGVPMRPLTTHWSRRPTASAHASLRLLGAAHRGR